MNLVKFPDYIKMVKTKFNADILNIDFENIKNNIININNKEYLFNNLSNYGNKGGNSVILKLYSVDEAADAETYDDVAPIAILKILKFSFKKKQFKSKATNEYTPTHKRFLNEIDALNKCKELKNENVIEVYDFGECEINNSYYLFYSMEVADYDLKSYIEEKHDELQFENKVLFCLELLDGINQLDNAIFYHRDIKPDNIFFADGKWKLGDLGLVDGKELHYKFNEEGKFIGPRGWASPEVMNKYLSEKKGFKYNYDCRIDHQSDIFQLGKVFWYIFQYNAPIGNINFHDFNRENERVFWIVRKMLHHSKLRRFNNVSTIIPLFQKINQECIIG
ncbi:protein kinase domain-containing protein [Flavobacterium columnare]|jgi:serine/threonine protein kinase|uniref:protein kinase domain-containing protein n=1 Tax=Flavobacterium columnare TaxID=996 RepID=UPI00403409A3